MHAESIKGIRGLRDKTQWDRWVDESAVNGFEFKTSFLGAVEEAYSIDYEFYYLRIMEGDQCILCLPVFVYPNMPLELTWKEAKHRQFAGRVRKFSNTAFRGKAIIVGTPLNDEFEFNLDPEHGNQAILALIKELYWLSRLHEADAIIFKNLLSRDLALTLEEYGFFWAESLPNGIIDCGFSTEDDFLETLDVRKRRNYRYKLRKASEARYGIKIQYGREFDIDENFFLFKNTYLKSDRKFETPYPGFYRALVDAYGNDVIWFSILENNVVVASSISYREGDSLVVKRVGFDYTSNIPYLYFVLHSELIRFAIKQKIKSIKLGPTSYEAKKEMGAKLQTTYLVVKHKNILINKAADILFNYRGVSA